MFEILKTVITPDTLSTAVVLIVVFFFMKYIKQRDESMTAITEQYAGIVKENSIAIGENTGVMRAIKDKLDLR